MRLFSALIVVAALLGVSVVLNPSAERHRAEIKHTIGERSPLASLLGVGALTAFTSTYHSLGVASYTEAGDRVVSYGFLGMVFVKD